MAPLQEWLNGPKCMTSWWCTANHQASAENEKKRKLNISWPVVGADLRGYPAEKTVAAASENIDSVYVNVEASSEIRFVFHFIRRSQELMNKTAAERRSACFQGVPPVCPFCCQSSPRHLNTFYQDLVFISHTLQGLPTLNVRISTLSEHLHWTSPWNSWRTSWWVQYYPSLSMMSSEFLSTQESQLNWTGLEIAAVSPAWRRHHFALLQKWMTPSWWLANCFADKLIALLAKSLMSPETWRKCVDAQANLSSTSHNLISAGRDQNQACLSELRFLLLCVWPSMHRPNFDACDDATKCWLEPNR